MMKGIAKKLFSRFLMIYATLGLLLCSISAAAENPVILLKTEKGDITIQLFPKLAPESVNNFINLVNSYHYDGLVFHRVINGFMIQTGGFSFDMTPRDPNAPDIVNEASNGLKNKRGMVALARGDHPDSACAQFFINHRDNPSLDATKKQAGYAVFGEVVSGMHVVDSIAKVSTGAYGIHMDVPLKPIRILSAKMLTPKVWESPQPQELSFERPVPVY